jgi:hypothetical protein
MFLQLQIAGPLARQLLDVPSPGVLEGPRNLDQPFTGAMKWKNHDARAPGKPDQA